MFQLSYLVYIFSGIGVGPLIMHLLNLNTESAVYISTILEEKGVYVANGLAWSYYFNYLKEALPKFKDAIKMYNSADNDIKLFLNKLLLLIPLDCHVVEDLNQVDNHTGKLSTKEAVLKKNSTEECLSLFTVYQLTVNEQEKYNLAIQYVEGPLKILEYMQSLEPIKAGISDTCDEEVKLLYRTLFEILADPVDKDIKEMCILVPFKAENPESLKNGGLVKCIMEAVNRSRTQVDLLGFIQPDESTSLIEEVPLTTKKIKILMPETEQEELIPVQLSWKKEVKDENDDGATTSKLV